MTVTAGNVAPCSVVVPALCALAPCRRPSLHKAMETTEAANAVGLENRGSALTVDARIAMGRQMTLDGISQQLPV
ncbi:hypothetical protein CVM73_23365 [Bradyrhizobium forestalis]|uniref:Uncharacterized protein n=1 Tax=Bradyrhizobium forestalis TaxID=1419263 RepID=A0A2M8R4R1_9BRAD|nr:hypothetical protein CVM73_23365 [Bradyrhizobium forestalis]